MLIHIVTYDTDKQQIVSSEKLEPLILNVGYFYILLK